MVFLLSHNDMDGYGCNLSILKAFGPSSRILNISYVNIINKLQYIQSEDLSEITEFYITDLKFGELETIELYKLVKHNQHINFIYVDHHPFDTEKQFKIMEKLKSFNNFKLIHTEKYCASYILYKYFIKNNILKKDENFNKIIEIINVFDTWEINHKKFKLALALNDLFYSWNRQRFLSELTKNYEITDNMKNEMKKLTIEKNTLFKELKEKGMIQEFNDILMFISDSFIAHMTFEYPGFKFYVNGRSYGSISIRINSDLISPEQAKLIKNNLLNLVSSNTYIQTAGGHDYAFGVNLYPEHKNKLMEIVRICIIELNKY